MKDRIKGPEVTASAAFTVPPPNVLNTKQGCNAAIASKFIHVFALYMYMYGTGTCNILDAPLKCFVCGANTLATFKPCGYCMLCEVCAKRIKRCPTCKVFTLCLNVS